MATYQVKDNATGSIYEVQDKGESSSSTTSNQIELPKQSTMSIADRAWDDLGRFGKGAYSATSFLPGIKNPLADKIYGGIPKANGLSEQIPEALGGVAPTVAMAGPFIQAARMAGASPLIASALGFGGFSGVKSAAEGRSLKNTSLDALLGAGTGLAYGIGGAAGEKLASTITKPMATFLNPVAVKTIGTATGQAAVGAATSSPDERLNGALVAGGLGILNPSKVVSQKEYDSQINKNAEVYKNMLPPTKTDIKNVEVKNNKKIDSSYQLMAQEGLPILKSQGADGKPTIDTSLARKQLQDKSNSLEDLNNQYLATNTKKQFNLNDVRKQSKDIIDSSTKNATEYKSRLTKLNEYINDEIFRNKGFMVDGKTMNNVKQGMWGIGYNQLAPNDQIVAQKIGNSIKNTIELAYPNSPIQKNNALLGRYLTADALLQQAHGSPVKTSHKGRIATLATGAGVGYLTGHIPGSIAGVVGGGMAENAISSYLSNPKRITGALKNKLNQLTVK